jgi:metal-sulfur cluster biosynthetic enzyme
MDEIVGSMDGVANVFPRMTFEPPWTSEMMSEDAKFALGL